jgi:hypothetical protein
MKFSFRKLFSTLLPRDIQLATRTRNQLYSPGWLGKKRKNFELLLEGKDSAERPRCVIFDIETR